MRVFLDFETRSVVDLRTNGLGRYASDSLTDIMCYAYAVDDGPVVCVSPVNGTLPPPPAGAEYVAHNAQFELAVWNNVAVRRYGWPHISPADITCTMARAYALALPSALEDCAHALGLRVHKDIEGHDLMMKMCKPLGFDKHGNPIWYGNDNDFARLRDYCACDVEVEREIFKRTFALSPTERQVWELDQRINIRGIPFDTDSVKAVLALTEGERERINDQMAKATGNAVTAATNVGSLKEWVADYGVPTDSLAKHFLNELLTIGGLPQPVATALRLRQEASRLTSIAKVRAILDREITGRVMYALQYHAATTGRWGGRGVQPHNFTRDLPDPAQVEIVLKAARDNEPAIIDAFGPAVAILSASLRGLIKAQKGVLLGGDYSAIESRGTAWIAGEQWKLDAFAACDVDPDLPDMYVQSYAGAFDIAPSAVTKDQRQIGKVMELAFGYQGGVGAFHSMARNYGVNVTDGEANQFKLGWRAAHPNIEAFWGNLQRAAIAAVRTRKETACGTLAWKVVGSFLLCRLPSGRVICYPYPKLSADDYGDCLSYMTVPDAVKWATYTKRKEAGEKNTTNIVEDESNSKKWARIKTYGGSLTENVVQALCRDILAEAMLRMGQRGLSVVLHIHDEIICEGDKNQLAAFTEAMLEQPSWAQGFPLAAKTWAAERYQK